MELLGTFVLACWFALGVGVHIPPTVFFHPDHAGLHSLLCANLCLLFRRSIVVEPGLVLMVFGISVSSWLFQWEHLRLFMCWRMNISLHEIRFAKEVMQAQ